MLRHSLVLGLFLASSAILRADFEGVLEERVHDFGVVPRGQQLTHYFRIVNPTSRPLHISNVRVSCGCTSARALEATVMPGRETAVYAVMDSRRFVGSKAVTIYVTFDQPRFEELRTVVQAFSREDLIFGPDALNFGKVKQGEVKSTSMTITIYNGAVQVLDAKSDTNFIQPTIKEVRRTGGEATYQVEAKVRPDTPAGVWFTDIWVTTNNPGYAKLRVPVTVEVEAPQPVKTEERKVEATKTNVGTEPTTEHPTLQLEVQEQPYQTAPMFVRPTADRPAVFPWFTGYFRR
jgi:hypothetical protein